MEIQSGETHSKSRSTNYSSLKHSLYDDKGEIDLKNYTYVPLLMALWRQIWRKTQVSCYVANGSVPDKVGDEVYSSVVGIDSVRIALLLAQLNGLQVCAGDVSCAFLQSQCKEKIYTIAGPEFGPKLQGKVLVMNKSIRWTLLSKCILPQILCKSAIQHRVQTFPHWSRIYGWKIARHTTSMWAMWVDNILVMSKEPLKVIQEFKEAGEYKLKGVGAPKYYLGGDPQQRKVDNYTCYKTHAKTYITCITDKIEKLIEWTLRELHVAGRS